MVAGILQVLLIDSEVIFQLFPSDLFRWLDGLQVSDEHGNQIYCCVPLRMHSLLTVQALNTSDEFQEVVMQT